MKKTKKTTAIGFTPQVGYLALVIPDGAIAIPKGVDGSEITLQPEALEKLRKDYISACNPMLVVGVGEEVKNEIGDLVGLTTRSHLPIITHEEVEYIIVRFNDILITYDA